jgi:oligoribonuclease
LYISENWVIHFEQNVLDGLAEWHQKTFADKNGGGNGLFADVLKSTFTNDEVEEQLLDLLKRHCQEGKCSLAGSSIHIDKEVLKLRMPKVHAYLHYRIIDVSSFQAIIRRWAPWIEQDIKKRLATKGQETVNHRAMDDIEWSISFMREFRPVLTKQHG